MNKISYKSYQDIKVIVLPGLAHINYRQVILEGIKFEKYDKIEYYML